MPTDTQASPINASPPKAPVPCDRRCFAPVASLALALCVLTAPAWPAEIYSNSTGGGAWSDPATWRGGAVPSQDDDVVIARDDTVIFDRDDTDSVTCQLLSLDPRAVLQFKSGAGRIILTAGNVVESYGLIKLDASKAAADQHEIRLIGAETDQRVLRLAKGGGLIVSGKSGLPKGRRNAVILSQPPQPEPPPAGAPAPPPVDPTGMLDAQGGSSLDLQRAEFVNLFVQAAYIDNTGAKPGERMNILRNRFGGTSRVMLIACDSGVLNDNLFERLEGANLQFPAIYLNSCPLVEVRNNIIRGTYSGGITGYGQGECVVQNNLVEKCPQGVYWYGSGFMLKGLTIRDCDHAMTLTSAAGAVENVTIERCKTGYYHGGATVQCSNMTSREMIPYADGYVIYYVSGPLTLLNCDIAPEQIKFHAPFVPEVAKEGKPRLPTVQSLSYVVAQVGGQVPPGISVEMRTAQPAAPLPPGAQDPNIRNSPAPLLKNNLTPLPKSLEPIIVHGWSFDADAKPVAAPAYTLNVLGPAGSAGGERQILKSLMVTPQTNWFRADPNDKKPTVEVTLP